ncbi:Phosphoglucomutase/phosphomannomutase alpha/beta/alpha domain I family protein [Cryptosporidium meleagridis]|uniref:Phosphoacetylglucosamine mutase n=1 Tax=Cryptosporidium meleagridis TaxID=93969 RepID=A0A2P4Z0C8_9CRYT|nr:Phosphoglucomutase/phosphomannomutase alpha/beta/alpha domain I family protein [Cryptosporidium meleagridis]
MSEFEERVTKVLTEKCGKLQKLKPLIYGTAGFRMNYDENPHRAEQVAMICTIIACLRSILEQKWVGVVITASHNPIQDNGVKIVDVTGSMLNKDFEQICFNVINHEDGNNPVKVLMHYFKEKLALCDEELNKIELSKAKLILGFDTRPSSKYILESIERFISEFEISRFLNFGFTTTPQLHFMVAFANGLIIERVPIDIRKTLMFENCIKNLENCSSSKKSDIISSFFDIYFAYHEYYFIQLVNLIQNDDHSFLFTQNSQFFFKAKPKKNENYKINENGSLLVDVANGVGKYHANKVSKILSYAGLNLKMINCDNPGKLNDGCGAEHIQKNSLPPVGLYSNQDYDSEGVDYVAALDGDADRLIYFIPNHFDKNDNSEIFLIDGDRISACYLLVITTLLNQSIREIKVETDTTPTLSLGVIQTAYANGASTKYLNNLLSALNPNYFRFSIDCVPTGVKHLHRKAEEYDIAVYFEANGHGTVIHREDKLKSWVEEMSKFGINNSSCRLLTYFLNLFNPVIGDAISDMLAFEVARKFVQARFGCKFSVCLYDDLNVIQDKVYLNRCDLETLICDKETEKFLVKPKAIQESIDNYISNLNDNHSRAFIRPSGTEEVARVYVESPTLERAKDIMGFIKVLLIKYFSKD